MKITAGRVVLNFFAENLAENTNVEIVPDFYEEMPIINEKTLIYAKNFNLEINVYRSTSCISIRHFSQYDKL